MYKQVIGIISTIFLWFFFISSTWALVDWQPLTETIYKSPHDPRVYQAIRLTNGMKVLLVSDVSAPHALAALALPVGSLENPASQQGLAHYLEHMILMGSRRFPVSGSLGEFLSKQGGRYNASTASWRTAFYLEVANDALTPAVDRLADAIAQPLLDPANADRERHAVNAELTLARSRDEMRMAQVAAETINPLHPGAFFAGGNLETLSDKPTSLLQDELIRFHQRYYSANLMVGVLYGNQSASQLAQLAADTFGKIPNRQAHIPPITVPVVTPEHKGILIHYVPAQPKKQLAIEFRIENNSDRFRSKTEAYINYLMTNRSNNTLADWLQKQGLAETLHVQTHPMSDRNEGVLTVGVTLTDKGLAERDRVVAAIFSYLSLLRSKGIKTDYFNEMVKVLDLDFRYPTMTRDMHYIECLADMMLRVPIAHVLDAPYRADRYDATAIAARLAEMTPQNARIWFISPKEPHNKTAYFVDAPYQINSISRQQQATWQQIGQQIRLSLPTLNPYIPDNFSLMASEVKVGASGTENTSIHRPQQLLDQPGLRLFYMPSRYFADEPKASVSINLRSRYAWDSARNQVLFVLTDYLARTLLDQLIYQAATGGIEFSTSYNHGLSLYAHGFTQHLPQFLTAWVAGYAGFQPTEEQLLQAKSWYRDQLEAAEKGRAYDLAIQPVRQLSQVPYTERQERQQLLDTIRVQDITAWRDHLLKKSAAEFLVTGNMTAQQASQLADSLKSQLGCEESTWWSAPEVVINQRLLASIQRTSVSTDAALAAVYIPYGYNEIEGMAYSNLLGKIIHPWFFEQLRTQEQLGYALFASPISVGRQWGITFLLQSSSKNPDYLYQRYLAFYPEIEKRLRTMKDEDFAQYQQGLINQLLQRPQTLDEEARRFKNDLDRGNFAFDSHEKVLAQVRQLTATRLADYFQQAVIQPQGLALLSQVNGYGHNNTLASGAGGEKYPDVSTLQKRLPLKGQVP